jgi:hypothetical protein
MVRRCAVGSSTVCGGLTVSRSLAIRSGLSVGGGALGIMMIRRMLHNDRRRRRRCLLTATNNKHGKGRKQKAGNRLRSIHGSP